MAELKEQPSMKLAATFDAHVKHEFVDQDVDATMRTMYRGVSMTSTPGSGRGRCVIANSSSCDNPRMASLWRRLVRMEPARASAAALALLLAAAVGAFIFAAVSSLPGYGALIAAAALVAVAGSGLLYAWRLAAGGLGD